MSSFRKRHVQKPIPGTRTSPQTGQVITSSGNPSLDVILGGGLPVGSICLIEEDKYVTFSKVLAKYFIAEGVLSAQSVLLGSLDDDPQEIMLKLPKPLNEFELEMEKATEQEKGDPLKNGLRIAWRYNDLPPVNSEQIPKKIGHHFNLMEHMEKNVVDFVDKLLWNGKPYVSSDEGYDEDKLGNVENISFGNQSNVPPKNDGDQNITSSISCKEMDLEHEQINIAAGVLSSPTVESTSNQFSNSVQIHDRRTSTNSELDNQQTSAHTIQPESVQIFSNSKYQSILKLIQSFAGEEKFATGALTYRSLCRICITSLGSPLWFDEDFSKNILKLLTVLRGIVRNSMTVCFITMPMNLIGKCDGTLVPKIRNLVDYAIELESFTGSERETHNAFKEYNGLLHVHKITAVNTLTAYMPETSDLAFKLRRKKFVIEKFHLPPEVQEDVPEGKPTLSCGAGVQPRTASLNF